MATGWRWLVPLAAVAALGGCLSVERGPMERFEVDSTPRGADVRSSSGWACVTPCVVQVARRGGFYLTISKDGYATEQRRIATMTDARADTQAEQIWNPVSLASSTVDAATGAVLVHVPNPLYVVLVPIADSSSDGAAQPPLSSGDQPSR